MGAKIPQQVAETDLSRLLLKNGLQRIYQGKVRDTYALPDYSHLLLVVATDRLSIFDFVLPCLVPEKGKILTKLTVFWLMEVLFGRTCHHLLASGREIDHYLPHKLRDNEELRQRALVVKKLQIIPVECIARGYLTGSGFVSYQKDGTVCGHLLPESLHDGSRLPFPIFTPSTKAKTGHDEHMDANEVVAKWGNGLERLTLSMYKAISVYALSKGIIMADTKFEVGRGLVLADEIGTPDSSRFWDKKEWETAVLQRKSPQGYDKQPVREWGKLVKTPFLDGRDSIIGIHQLDPSSLDHIDFVHQLKVPSGVVENTATRYQEICRRLIAS